MNVISTIEQQLHTTLTNLFDVSPDLISKSQLTINTDAHKQQFGDLSSNAALIIGKALSLNPRETAADVKEALSHKYIDRIEIAGPGFLNIFLSQEGFLTLATQLYEEGAHYFAASEDPKQSYCIEFVSANPTGPLHIGHGRGGIIGDVLSRILSFLGNNVTKEYYINDAGVQMNKLGSSFKIRCLQVLGQEAELPEDGYQGDYLVTLAQECFNEFGTELLSKPDEFFVTYAKEHLLERIKQVLTNYGITYDVWFSEKTLHDSGAISSVIEHLASTKYLYDKDGATWLKSSELGDDKDRVVKKASGDLTYLAADIAYTQDKVARGFDQLIYILGQDHHGYVARLKAVMAALGYDPQRLHVILYQLVTVKEGGQALKLSKRAGRIISLDDIIKTVGTDVARFFYLHKKADAHLDFDIELALKHTDENPVYYIQYAYVRTKSIKEKAQQHEILHAITTTDLQHLGEPERLLLKKIASLKEQLHSIEKNYQTHQLTYYTIELAQTFHSYYSHNKVIDPTNIDTSRARLALVELVGNTLKTAFDLLGISAPEKM